jgi:hypothetical protein
MGEHVALYKSLYRRLGYPLTDKHRTPARAILAAERRLGIKVPSALRDYYLVAGREKRFNRACQRLLTPSQWFVENRSLVFFEENQQVCFWGVPLRAKSKNPTVSQAVNHDRIVWRSEGLKCSEFLTSMLMWHALNGGMPFSKSAEIPKGMTYNLKPNGWKTHKELCGETVYSRPGEVMGLVEGFIKPRIVVGATSRKAIEALGQQMGLEWDVTG